MLSRRDLPFQDNDHMENREKKPRNQRAEPENAGNRIQTRLPLLPHWISVCHRMKPASHLHHDHERNPRDDCQSNLDFREQFHARGLTTTS
jgi:hypothetical protein